VSIKKASSAPAASAVTVRGGRGGLPLGSSGVNAEEKVSLLSQTQKGGTVTVADVLLDAGVFLLSRPRRMAVAAQLEAAGVTADDLRRVARWIEDGEPDAATSRRYLASVVQRAEDFREAAAAVAEHERRQQLRREARTATHTWGFPSPYWSCDCEGCRSLRAKGVADQGRPVSMQLVRDA
jgi:hypothetical protein